MSKGVKEKGVIRRLFTEQEVVWVACLVRRAGRKGLCEHLKIPCSALEKALAPTPETLREEYIEKLNRCTLEELPKKKGKQKPKAASKVGLKVTSTNKARPFFRE